MKYLHNFNEDNLPDKDSPMKRLLSKGKDVEVVTEYKPKSTKHREKVGKKNKEFMDNVERWTKENDKEENISESNMKYLHKYNEDNLPVKKISNDRVTEIISDLKGISSSMNESMDKCRAITKELDGYTSKSDKNNTQIDDAFVNMQSLESKFMEALNLIVNINFKLNDYVEKGEDKIY